MVLGPVPESRAALLIRLRQAVRSAGVSGVVLGGTEDGQIEIHGSGFTARIGSDAVSDIDLDHGEGRERLAKVLRLAGLPVPEDVEGDYSFVPSRWS